MNQIMKIMELMKMFNGNNTNEENNSSTDNSINTQNKENDLDYNDVFEENTENDIFATSKNETSINTNLSPQIRVLKASIPFLNSKQQKTVLTSIKIFELLIFADTYKPIQAKGFNNKPNNYVDMCRAIKNELPLEQKRKLEKIITIIEMKESLT